MVKTPTDSRQSADGKILAVFSYLSVFCIIPLLFKKNRPFIRHHGKQGLVLFVAQVGAFVGHIAAGTWFLSLCGVILTGYAVVGLSQVLHGQCARLWLVSDIAEKITL
ncbi:MAG: hypothetical protein KC897_08580 [Candidatus Omnitrophica bacterium]|nr:hypothetical protein [Candidatus Omnitrophota bacterium]MCB9720792.1 hypothetical protein [Candidatus Omnitrophota bacterium]